MISTNSLTQNIMWITRLLEILTRILDFFFELRTEDRGVSLCSPSVGILFRQIC